MPFPERLQLAVNDHDNVQQTFEWLLVHDRKQALVLMDADGQVVWKQDEGLSDESPLDLAQAESQIEALTLNL